MKKLTVLIATILIAFEASAQSARKPSLTNGNGRITPVELLRHQDVTLFSEDGPESPLPQTDLLPESSGQVDQKPSDSVEMKGANPANATKEKPFINSLEMKFVPVPITGGPTDGKKLLFSVWETRVSDYAAYATENPGINMEWNNLVYEGHKQTGEHPVVNVSWEDAQSFCRWLSKKEGKTYRLPTDHEWSCAVGIGDQEVAETIPTKKNLMLDGVYPWGKHWPPAKAAGNFSGQESAAALKIEGYIDEHAFTAPVGSYMKSKDGLQDLAGNAWEWCEDWYSLMDKEFRVLRGGSWSINVRSVLLSSYRFGFAPANRLYGVGFRVVCE